jgi:hypothetical protein
MSVDVVRADSADTHRGRKGLSVPSAPASSSQGVAIDGGIGQWQ